MLYKATVSFAGSKVSMRKGEVRAIADKAVVDDLIHAGYIEPDAQEAEIVEKPEEKSETPADNTDKPEEKPEEKSTKPAEKKNK